jgi:hypothetical protein
LAFFGYTLTLSLIVLSQLLSTDRNLGNGKAYLGLLGITRLFIVHRSWLSFSIVLPYFFAIGFVINASQLGTWELGFYLGTACIISPLLGIEEISWRTLGIATFIMYIRLRGDIFVDRGFEQDLIA